MDPLYVCIDEYTTFITHHWTADVIVMDNSVPVVAIAYRDPDCLCISTIITWDYYHYALWVSNSCNDLSTTAFIVSLYKITSTEHTGLYGCDITIDGGLIRLLKRKLSAIIFLRRLNYITC